MQEAGLVSVIVPIYGVEKYLPKCINSIIGQTYKNLEIILVDDGSKDSCSQICDEYKKRDKRIKVIHKVNGGVCTARNEGLMHSSGQYIQFVDGDDWIAPCMVEKLVEHMSNAQSDFVMCSFYFSGDTDIKHKLYLKQGIYNNEAIHNDIFPIMLYTGTFYEFGLLPSLWNKLYKRELIENILTLPTDIFLGEDVLCTYALMRHVRTFCVIDEPLYYYRQNMLSVTKSYRQNQIIETRKLIHYVKELYQCSDWERQCAYYTYSVVLADYHNEGQQCSFMEIYQRYKGLKVFIKCIGIQDLIRKFPIKNIPFVHRVELFIISHRLGLLLLFCIVSINWFKYYVKR